MTRGVVRVTRFCGGETPRAPLCGAGKLLFPAPRAHPCARQPAIAGPVGNSNSTRVGTGRDLSVLWLSPPFHTSLPSRAPNPACRRPAPPRPTPRNPALPSFPSVSVRCRVSGLRTLAYSGIQRQNRHTPPFLTLPPPYSTPLLGLLFPRFLLYSPIFATIQRIPTPTHPPFRRFIMFPRSITKNTPKPHKTAPLGVPAAIPAPPPPAGRGRNYV